MVVFIVLSLLCFTMTYISKHEHQQEDWPSPSNYFTVVILHACHRIGVWLMRVRWAIKFKLRHSGVLRVNWGVSLLQARNCFEVWCVSKALKQSLLCHTITILAISLAYSLNLTQLDTPGRHGRKLRKGGPSFAFHENRRCELKDGENPCQKKKKKSVISWAVRESWWRWTYVPSANSSEEEIEDMKSQLSVRHCDNDTDLEKQSSINRDLQVKLDKMKAENKSLKSQLSSQIKQHKAETREDGICPEKKAEDLLETECLRLWQETKNSRELQSHQMEGQEDKSSLLQPTEGLEKTLLERK